MMQNSIRCLALIYRDAISDKLLVFTSSCLRVLKLVNLRISADSVSV